MARQPTVTCAIRQAIVVIGAGWGWGNAKSMVRSPGPDLRGRRTSGSDVPGAGRRLPEVLLVAEPLEPGAERVGPVPLELVEEEGVPVGHGCRRHADSLA